MTDKHEQRAGRAIDANLEAAGWLVQDFDGFDFSAGRNRQCIGAYILNLTGGNPALASVGTNVTQRPMTGKTTLRRPHCVDRRAILMEWTPPPDGIAVCQGGVVFRPPEGGGIHGRG